MQSVMNEYKYNGGLRYQGMISNPFSTKNLYSLIRDRAIENFVNCTINITVNKEKFFVINGKKVLVEPPTAAFSDVESLYLDDELSAGDEVKIIFQYKI